MTYIIKKYNNSSLTAKRAKRGTNFLTIFPKNFLVFEFFSSALHLQTFKNILATPENLSRETKNLNFEICKISLRKNLSLISLTPLTSFSMKRVGLAEQLYG